VKVVAPNIVFRVSNPDAAITSATPGLEILIAGWESNRSRKEEGRRSQFLQRDFAFLWLIR
jgi:hypothetical protein